MSTRRTILDPHRERVRTIHVPKTIVERRCLQCDEWFDRQNPLQELCSNKCRAAHQEAHKEEIRLAREAKWKARFANLLVQLHDEHGWTYARIGELAGVSAARASNIVARAKRGEPTSWI